MLFRRELNCDKNDENMKRNFEELNDEEASDEFSETAAGSPTQEDLAAFHEIDEEFLKGLNAWVELAPSDEERKNRERAKERMIEFVENEYTEDSSTELSLDNLGLSSLPKEIGYLESLTNLDLSDNQFELFPSEILKLTSLENLLFGGNGLKILPPKIGGLVNLKYLFLGENELKTLPAEMGELRALIKLHLDNNKLETIPVEMFGISNLEVLDLSDNPQLYPSAELLKWLSDLEGDGCDVRYPDHFSFNSQADLAKTRLAQIATTYKEENAIEATNPAPNIRVLLHRFLTEGIGQRGEIEEILQSVNPTLGVLEENPSHLKWAEEIASHYLDGCVNQPVAGWSEISASASIATAPTMLEKLESAKHLLVNDQVKDFVGKNFARSAVEVEAGNALLREVHQKLLSEGVITKPWLAVPGRIAYELTVSDWLTPEIVQEFRVQIEPLLQKTPEELAEFLLESVHCKTWGEINFPEQLKEINDPYEKDRAVKLETFESLIKDTPQGPDRETLGKKFAEDQETLKDQNYATISEKIATLTRVMLEREMQERGMNSSAAGSGAPASVSENQLTANHCCHQQ
jgi:hypothetical protein